MSEYLLNTRTGEQWVLKQSMPPAQHIPHETRVVTNISGHNSLVYKHPSSTSSSIGFISPGDTVEIKCFYLPDTVGFGASNMKLWPVATGVGYVNRADFTQVTERLVNAVQYIDNKRTLIFNDNTYLVVPEPVHHYVVPATGRFKRGAYDWERPDWGGKPRTNSECPQTIPMWDKPDFFTLSEAWQRLWFNLIAYFAYGAMTDDQLFTAWADITTERKALTDNHGLAHFYADLIMRIFVNNDPIMQKGLIFGGTMVKMKGLTGNVIEALDPSQEAPSLEWLLQHPWLWGWTTVIQSDYVSSKWPNLKRFTDNGVPYLILGYSGRNRVLSEDLIALKNNQVYSPYTRA